MPLVKPSSRWPLRPGEKHDHIGRIICPHGERRMWCKVCVLNRSRAQRANRPDVDLRSQLKNYGVTVEWYRAKEAEQNGCCAMCGRPEWAKRNGKTKRLSVDHDHDTNIARELLCSRCNMIIGILEQAEEVARGVVYLARHGKVVALAVEPMKPQS